MKFPEIDSCKYVLQNNYIDIHYIHYIHYIPKLLKSLNTARGTTLFFLAAA